MCALLYHMQCYKSVPRINKAFLLLLLIINFNFQKQFIPLTHLQLFKNSTSEDGVVISKGGGSVQPKRVYA